MTIDSGWVRVFKEEAPDAFQATYPFSGTPKVAYIDGMPLLMTCERNVRSWEDLLRFNYARHINRYFRLGCQAVVLAFDDYERVPMAKAITQANRVKKKAAYEFGEGQQLPPTMPHQYNEKLSNRIFKRRVIDMVCNRVVEHISVSAAEKYTRKFVIDYTGCPIMFEAQAGENRFDACGRKPTFLVDVPPMGEADVKYVRWADHFKGDMVAYSIDGDFIPIALMHYEAQMCKLREQYRQQQPSQPSQPPGTIVLPPVFNIAIYRIKYKTPASAVAGAAQQGRGKKGNQNANSIADGKQLVLVSGKGGNVGCSLPLPSPPPAAAAGGGGLEKEGASNKTKVPPREFEYVNVPKLYLALRNVFSSFCPSYKRHPMHHYHYMRMLAVLIGLGGTDFSRGLPYIGPSTLWNMICNQSVFTSLLDSYDPTSGLMRAGDACDTFACNVYMTKFATHFKKAHAQSSLVGCPSSSSKRKAKEKDEEDDDDDDEMDGGGFRSVLGVLQCSQLSEKTRNDLPSYARVNATFRNINWLLHYWTCRAPEKTEGDNENQGLWDYSACYPNPVCAEYGFKYRSEKKRKSKGKRRGNKKGKKAAKTGTDSSPSSSSAIQWLDEESVGGSSSSSEGDEDEKEESGTMVEDDD